MTESPSEQVVNIAQSLDPGDRVALDALVATVEAIGADPALPAPIRALYTSARAHLDAVASTGEVKSLDAARAVLAAAARRIDMRRSLADAPATVPDSCDLTLLADFVAEGRDLLQGAESALLCLEQDPDNDEAINTVFRAFHTIKGTSAYLGLHVVSGFANSAEALLTRMRDHEIRCQGGYAGLALQSVDVLADLFRRVQQDADGGAPSPLPSLAALEARLVSPERFDITDDERRTDLRSQAAPRLEGGRPNATAAEATVRVRTDRLDRLIEMVGELVIAQSLVAQDGAVSRARDHAFASKLSHSAKISRELQTLSMSMRMVPLHGTFQKLKRLTRDVAHRTGKTVHFACSGEETEVDKALVDVIGDPLMHMLRNAVDHGIESPAERLASGKDAHGTVAVRAYQAGGSVVVELTDDGRGLNRARILRKAEQFGLVAPGAQLADAQVWPLVFTPGFSTADQLTDVSGRGVGMDVVKRNIEAIQGGVEIDSTAGQGARFTVRVPLTLAITDGMLVRVAQERYILPTRHIRFSFRPDPGALSTVVGRGEVAMLRDSVLPIVRLSRLLGIDHAVENPAEAILVVVSDDAMRVAVMVDEVMGQQQVIAKSLGQGLPAAPGVSGGAILGDGKVALILDVYALLAPLRPGPRAELAVA